MENEKKEVTAENGKIVLHLNSYMEPGPCVFCGAECRPDGFDFHLEGSVKLVCTNCVSEIAPELAVIHDGAHKWRDIECEKAWRQGEKSGKESAGRIILATINEEPIQRIRRVCEQDLGAEEGVPF